MKSVFKKNQYNDFPDEFDRFLIALRDIVVDRKNVDPQTLAEEVERRLASYHLGDRESEKEERFGVKENLEYMVRFLEAIIEKFPTYPIFF